MWLQAGTTDLTRERLNIVVNSGASLLAQVFSTRPEMPSGRAAFLVFTLVRSLLTLCSVTKSVCPSPAVELTPAVLTMLLLAGELVVLLLASNCA